MAFEQITYNGKPITRDTKAPVGCLECGKKFKGMRQLETHWFWKHNKEMQ